ncbi:MAG TPA: D-alanine--D-alanine ligase [Capsulimonadaceae bacterium]|jgi:D-alanine-D-alanine ligase
MTKLNVAVLMGGTSSERDISLSTGKQILGALDPAKYRVFALDTQTRETYLPPPSAAIEQMVSVDGSTQIAALPQLPQAADRDRPDVVIVALHGKGGEDGTIQGFLDIVGIPYTGSGVLASALAMDKSRSKTFLAAHGVRFPKGVAIRRHDPRPADFPLPAVVKPSLSGSSDGLTIVPVGGDLNAALDTAFALDETVLIEEFVKGMEITCAVLGNDTLEVLPLVEIVPANGVYDREAKYTPGATDEICPARLSDDLTAKAQKIAQVCHAALGCRGMSRTDMIVTASGEIYALEVNTIPGMTPTSLLPKAAATAGYSFPQLLDKLVGYALEGAAIG